MDRPPSDVAGRDHEVPVEAGDSTTDVVVDYRAELDGLLSKSAPIPGNYDLLKVAATLPGDRVLDVGFGKGSASMVFALAGKQVVGITVGEHCIKLTRRHFKLLGITAIDAPFLGFTSDDQFDLIWMSHVVEHSNNPGGMLQKARTLLSDDGWLVVCVPPFKHRVVRGHLSVGWNLGLLMYNLLVCGFNVREGHFIQHGYNVFACVRRDPELDWFLENRDATDLLVHEITPPDKVRRYWPDAVVDAMDEANSFEGNVDVVQWPDHFRATMNSPIQVQIDPEIASRLLQLGRL